MPNALFFIVCGYKVEFLPHVIWIRYELFNLVAPIYTLISSNAIAPFSILHYKSSTTPTNFRLLNWNYCLLLMLLKLWTCARADKQVLLISYYPRHFLGEKTFVMLCISNEKSRFNNRSKISVDTTQNMYNPSLFIPIISDLFSVFTRTPLPLDGRLPDIFIALVAIIITGKATLLYF